MELRLKITRRRLALALFVGAAVSVSLFALGFQLGLRMAAAPVTVVERAVPRPKPALRDQRVPRYRPEAAPWLRYVPMHRPHRYRT